MMLLSIPQEARMAEHALRVVSSRLMEAIHVELPYKAIDLVVSEVSR